MSTTSKHPFTAEASAKEITPDPKRAIDTAYGAKCWVAFESENSAIVYYDDEPDCQVSTGNRPGRFAAIAKTGGAK